MATVSSDSKTKKEEQTTTTTSRKQCIFGVDLSYSVNKKSYNLLNASSFNTFIEKSDTMKGSNSPSAISKIVSFGDDRYGLIYAQNGLKNESLSGFCIDKGEYKQLSESVKTSLSKLKLSKDFVVSNTASAQQIVLFDNETSKFQCIDLFDKEEKETLKKMNNYKADIAKKDNDDEAAADEDAKEKEKEKETASTKKGGKKRAAGTSRSGTYKVKSSIKAVFKHLLLTANGSLYGLTANFHKKYVNNNKIMDVKCDGSRCTLCLDENGVLWSFGINLFGKLGLKRNDKKQIYTNPREISIFKAYKVRDFGLTNKCCIAVCANGSVYGWGCHSKSSLGKNSDIWYTPKMISTEDESVSVGGNVDSDAKKKRDKYRVFAGFRFIILLNESNNKLFVINTEFGFSELRKEKNGFLVKMDEIKLPKEVKVREVVPSNESAIIICEEQ